MPDRKVRPTGRKLTDADARHLLADGLIRTCHVHGPSRVAVEAGCDEKTIRRARDEDSTLGLAIALNLLDIDAHVLDALFAAKGMMLVPLAVESSDGTVDVIPAAGAAIYSIGKNRLPQSPGGSEETDLELIQTEADVDALFASVLERRAAIAAAKLRRAS